MFLWRCLQLILLPISLAEVLQYRVSPSTDLVKVLPSLTLGNPLSEPKITVYYLIHDDAAQADFLPTPMYEWPGKAKTVAKNTNEKIKEIEYHVNNANLANEPLIVMGVFDELKGVPEYSSMKTELYDQLNKAQQEIDARHVFLFVSSTTFPSLNQFYCFPSLNSCNSETSSCSGHGTCMLQQFTAPCYRCTCQSGRRGDACESTDYISSFHIVFWTVVVFILLVAVVVNTMLKIDLGKDMWMYSAPSNRKKD
ncbi:EGF-like domain-containing protein [Rozella allomycis CSF55]|uniref:EGF-like domain-containing protein n=1 Tax=Rozella allomycis (strain CSF55) TaxID=988480 RepID=A0A075ARG7_ROZAC|nr:EGF-like domain-containing protein [Rozella allomycis CSF55]|eukprot:EPZ31321.1 EGF-like domain-containing protein [Rozella allomycis CSF55]